eukprot:1696379-Prymnesium_polylepis.1
MRPCTAGGIGIVGGKGWYGATQGTFLLPRESHQGQGGRAQRQITPRHSSQDVTPELMGLA